jgi:hypothetical protein
MWKFFTKQGQEKVQDFGVSVIRALAVRLSTFQSIANSTNVAVIFDDADANDPEGMHDPAVNPSRMTCKKDGVYSLRTTVVFAAHATGYRGIALRVNAGSYYGQISVPSIGSVPMDISTGWDIALSVGDYVEVVIIQTSGGALNVGSNNATTGAITYFEATRLGPL